MLRDQSCVSGSRFRSQSVFLAALVLAYTLSITFLTDPAAAQGVVVPVAARNQQAAGLPAGVLYDAMGAHALTASGHVFLESFVGDGRFGYWLGTPGGLTVAALSGDPAPSDLGEFLQNGLGFSAHSVNAAGQVAFGGATSSGNSGIWMGQPGTLTRVVNAGDSAPGAAGAEFAPFTHDDLHLAKFLTDAGQLVFDARLAGAGVNSSNDRGIWMGPPNGLGLVVRKGQVAPGTPDGVTFLGASAPDFGRFANNTQVAFNASLAGTGITSTNRSSSWVGGPGALTLVARAGDQAPGLPDGLTFSAVSLTDFSASSHLSLLTSLTGNGITESNDRAVWVGQPGSLTLAAREGDQAPGLPDGVTIASIETRGVAVNSSGQVAFVANLSGPGVDQLNDASLWVGPPGSLALVARQGDQAAGAPAGVTYGEFPSIFDRLQLTSTGEIAFAMELTGPGVSDANREGIWVGDTLIYRGSINSAYGPFANDVGQVAFTEVGSSRVLLYTPVPEPPRRVFAAVGLAAIVCQCRKRPQR